MGKYYLSTFLVCIIVIANSVDLTTARYAKAMNSATMVKRQASADPRVSVIFTCGDFYNSELNMLFPPGKASVSRIDNVTLAATVNKESLNTFCANISVYSQCVQEGLRSPANAMDLVVSRLIDVERFPFWMNDFCSQSQKISENFVCTYNAINASETCGMGIEDMMIRIQQVVQEGTRTSEDVVAEVCSNVSGDFKCTWDLVGDNCDGQYASRMSSIYQGLFSCPVTVTGSSSIFNSSGSGIQNLTDLMSCYMPYIEAATKRGQSIVLTPTNSENYTSLLMQFVGEEMEIICENYIDTMVPCIVEKLENSNKSMDLVYKQLLDYKRLGETYKDACSLTPAFKKHGACLGNNIKKMVESNNPCLKTVTQKFGIAFDFGGNLGGNRTQLVCSALETAVTCFKPEIASCDHDLANSLESLIWKMSNCPAPDTSSAPLATASMTTIISLFAMAVISIVLH